MTSGAQSAISCLSLTLGGGSAGRYWLTLAGPLERRALLVDLPKPGGLLVPGRQC